MRPRNEFRAGTGVARVGRHDCGPRPVPGFRLPARSKRRDRRASASGDSALPAFSTVSVRSVRTTRTGGSPCMSAFSTRLRATMAKPLTSTQISAGASARCASNGPGQAEAGRPNRETAEAAVHPLQKWRRPPGFGPRPLPPRPPRGKARAEEQISLRYCHVALPVSAAWPTDQSWEGLEPSLGRQFEATTTTTDIASHTAAGTAASADHPPADTAPSLWCRPLGESRWGACPWRRCTRPAVLLLAAVLGRFWAILYIGGRKNAEVMQDGRIRSCRIRFYLFRSSSA